jgi:hypothetical protein
VSLPTLRAAFDQLEFPSGVLIPAPDYGINLLIDCVVFGREYGYICFHDTRQIIYFHEIKTETVADLREGLHAILDAGFQVKSVTIDGRRGFYENIKKILGPVPVQMWLFHQKAIIRRYLTDRPKSLAGQDLKALMNSLLADNIEDFIERFYALKQRHQPYLNERNENRQFRHSNVRAAYRSMQQNMPMVFTFRDFPKLDIPTTTGRLEGFFSHLKEKIRVHRGLRKDRKKNAIKFLLNFKK